MSSVNGCEWFGPGFESWEPRGASEWVLARMLAFVYSGSYMAGNV